LDFVFGSLQIIFNCTWVLFVKKRSTAGDDPLAVQDNVTIPSTRVADEY
jgi:hypothetical protein